jgi:hypothetical protein
MMGVLPGAVNRLSETPTDSEGDSMDAAEIREASKLWGMPDEKVLFRCEADSADASRTRSNPYRQ